MFWEIASYRHNYHQPNCKIKKNCWEKNTRETIELNCSQLNINQFKRSYMFMSCCSSLAQSKPGASMFWSRRQPVRKILRPGGKISCHKAGTSVRIRVLSHSRPIFLVLLGLWRQSVDGVKHSSQRCHHRLRQPHSTPANSVPEDQQLKVVQGSRI